MSHSAALLLATWFSLVMGCGSPQAEPAQVAGAGELPGQRPCAYAPFRDVSNALSRSAPAIDDDEIDAPVQLYDRVGWAMQVTDEELLWLDQIRATCHVDVPLELGARRLRRELARVESEMVAQLQARAALIHPSEHERLETPVFSETVVQVAEGRLRSVTTAISLARDHRTQVLSIAVTDACTVERVTELEWWHDRVVELEAADALEASVQARDIASAVGWATPDVHAPFRETSALSAFVDADSLSTRRQQALALLTRCPEPVPIELMPD